MIFSVIVPVFNVDKYLKKCVESIISQKDADFEIILVDDGSTDGSLDLCDKYAKKYSNIITIHKENGGLSDARNAGIKMAKGKYILFIDGDDYISPDSLKAIAEVIENGNYPDIVCLELMKFFDCSKEIVAMGDGVDKRIDQLLDDKLFEYLAELPKYPASACTKAIRRELFIEHDLYFTKGLLSEDLEWCIRLFLAAKTFRYCPNRYYFYRQARNGSISNTSSEKKVMDILSTFQKWTSYCNNLSNNAKKKMVSSYMEYIFRFLLLGYENVSKANRKIFKRKIKNGSWILGIRNDKISICIRTTYKIFGIKLTGILLKKYLEIRGF